MRLPALALALSVAVAGCARPSNVDVDRDIARIDDATEIRVTSVNLRTGFFDDVTIDDPAAIARLTAFFDARRDRIEPSFGFEQKVWIDLQFYGGATASAKPYERPYVDAGDRGLYRYHRVTGSDLPERGFRRGYDERSQICRLVYGTRAVTVCPEILDRSGTASALR